MGLGDNLTSLDTLFYSMTRTEFIQHLKDLGTLGDLTDTQIGTYLDFALNALAQHQPLRYRLMGVPTDESNDGFYTDVIPTAAIDVEGVFQYQTDVQIEFDVVLDSVTQARQLWLKGVKLPSYVGITTYAGQIQDYSNDYYPYNYPGQPTRFISRQTYEKFDVVYTAVPTVEDLNATQETAVKSFVEAEGYGYRAGLDENLSDIVDRGPSGESTTFRNSRKSESYAELAKDCMAEFKRLAIRPHLSAGGFGEIQKFWAPGEIS